MMRRREHVKLDRERAAHEAAHTVIAGVVEALFGQMDRPALVAVGGPGGIGKTRFAHDLAHALECAVVLGLDDYKRPREERYPKGIYGAHPEANELDLLRQHLGHLRQGQAVERPLYCSERGRIWSSAIFAPDRFVVVEGEVATYRQLADLMDFSVFIDSHWKTQLNTRITRDIEERGYDPKKAIATFLHSNLGEFEEFGRESKDWADVHLHCNEDYTLVIDAVCSTRIAHLEDYIEAATGEG
jgi:uridine kinase